jgi:hypothetical protein
MDEALDVLDRIVTELLEKEEEEFKTTTKRRREQIALARVLAAVRFPNACHLITKLITSAYVHAYPGKRICLGNGSGKPTTDVAGHSRQETGVRLPSPPSCSSLSLLGTYVS